jgi:type II secretory pathway component PulF
MLFLNLSGNAFYSPEHQAELGGSLTTWSTEFLTFLSIVPEWVWGVLIIGTFIFLLYEIKRRKNKERNNRPDSEQGTHGNCH